LVLTFTDQSFSLFTVGLLRLLQLDHSHGHVGHLFTVLDVLSYRERTRRGASGIFCYKQWPSHQWKEYSLVGQTTWRYIPEDSTLHNHCCENRKSYVVNQLLDLNVSQRWL
jgi:hypothetical protein